MRFFDMTKIDFTDVHRKTLNDLAEAMDTNPPGTILEDFQILLDVVGEGMPVTPAHQLKLKNVNEINERISQTVELGLKRPKQKSYPHINGLYLVLRASGMSKIDETKKTPRLVLDTNLVAQWDAMSPTQKYCNLLEAWLFRGNESLIGERELVGATPDHLHGMANMLLSYFSDKDKFIAADNKHAMERIDYSPGLYNLGLMTLFGWIELTQKPPEDGDSFVVETIQFNPIGRAFIQLMGMHLRDNFVAMMELEFNPILKYGYLQNWLQPYFPTYNTKFEIAVPERVEGVRIFKVSLGKKVWRRIAINGNKTFDYLAKMILVAFDFDFDHLYKFNFKGRTGEKVDITHPYMNDGFASSEVHIHDVPLEIGQSIPFVYDFGDNWQFNILLEEINPDSGVKTGDYLEKHGEAPQQYPNWDEEY